MKFSISRTPKDELVKRSRFKCIHGHNGIDHPNCFEQQNKSGERVGFLDIECEDLKADYGIIFTYYIKVAGKNKFYSDHLTKDDIKKYTFNKSGVAKEDTRVIESLVRDLSNFDRVIGHYSSRFDLGFIRTRAVICGVEFPEWGTLWQTDTWNILKHKFQLSRNSLANGTEKLTGYTNKNHLSLNLKHAMLRADDWAIKYTLDHNRRDVIDTERLYNEIAPYARLTKSSI